MTRRRPGEINSHRRYVIATIIYSTAIILTSTTRAQECQREQFGSAQNVACKCDARHCDTRLEFEWPRDDSQIVRMTSDAQGARFHLDSLAVGDLYDEPKERPQVERLVQLDIGKRYQQIVGYGGAFTDSAAMLISSHLDNRTRRALMESYFGPAGLNYNLARIPIGGTDMSWRPYSYNDLDMQTNRTDFAFKSFHLQREDFDYKLPLIREANQIRRNSVPGACTKGRPDPAVKLLASSWSAPNWMKSNDNLVQGGLKDSMDGRYYDAYARYIIRFLEEYERQLNGGGGQPEPEVCKDPVKIWALTPQNEPCTPGRLGYQVVNYNSVNFEPKQMGQFIRLNLIPNLLQVNRTARDLALFIWDDTLLGFDRYKQHLFDALISDQQDIEDDDEQAQLKLKMKMSHYDQFDKQLINDYVRGLALHWYSQALDKLPYKSLYDVRQWMPQRYSMISTEASFIGRPHPGEWARGEKYARDIIENFRSGSIGWIDWNLALNLEGGPTWSHNFLDAPILVDQNRKSVFYKNPMFYAIGHLSRFIRAGSSILESHVFINDHREEVEGTTSNSTSSSTLPAVEQESLEAVRLKDAGWRRVDEWEEQTSALLVVASELATEDEEPEVAPLKRRIALVMLNRSAAPLRVKLNLANCRAPPGARPLNLELAAKSITSYAFNC